MKPVGLRLLKLVGESGVWRVTGRVHAWLYRRTGGKVGHGAGKLTHLLLTTTGRKSGQQRTVALSYIADGGSYVVVASNGGADRHPAWWFNLQQVPEATVQVGADTVDVMGREATDYERARLWPELKRVNPFYSRYEKITDRRIPIVILEPLEPRAA